MSGSEEKRQDRARRKKILLELLREARRNTGLRQADLAQRLSLPQSLVSKYKSGERQLDLHDLTDVCEALGFSESEFVKRFEERCGEAWSEHATSPHAVPTKPVKE